MSESEQQSFHRVVIVHLRRPRMNDPNESRGDPFWEFGSFGCTGCHRRNLMHRDRINELEGVRLAFAQGGPEGFKLVHLTPPVSVVKHQRVCELRWDSAMPFRYDAAPILVNAKGDSHFPLLLHSLRGVNRSTWPAKFSSQFRSRRTPLRADIGAEMISVYERARKQAGALQISSSYEQAIAVAPPRVDRDRANTYKLMVARVNAVED